MEASRHVNEDEQPKHARIAGVGRSDAAAASHANRVELVTMVGSDCIPLTHLARTNK